MKIALLKKARLAILNLNMDWVDICFKLNPTQHGWFDINQTN